MTILCFWYIGNFMHVLGCIGNFMHVLGCILKWKLFLPIQASACVNLMFCYESIDELSARLPNGYGMVLGFSQLGEK